MTTVQQEQLNVGNAVRIPDYRITTAQYTQEMHTDCTARIIHKIRRAPLWYRGPLVPLQTDTIGTTRFQVSAVPIMSPVRPPFGTTHGDTIGTAG